MSAQSFVIVGASLAGAKAAEELREAGFDGKVTLIGAETERPYERPPLSKDYLRGESEKDKAFVHDESFYRDHDIDLHLSALVTGIDPGEGRVTLEDARRFSFDKLLLTTGSAVRPLPVPGADLGEVYHLRTLAQSTALRERIEAGGHVVVVGAGWIGSEVAASARQKGCDVTLIDPLQLPNEKIFGREIGEFYRDVHAAHGVKLILGDGVESFSGDETVTRVRTMAGQQVDCDFVVVGAGVVPRIELAHAAGIEVDDGILVDESLRTSADNVFAAGDVANAWNPFYNERIRVEHWSNALHQGPAAARSMVGQQVSFDRVPYFFSDQYDVGMEYSGYAREWDEVVFRGDRDSGEFIAFWVKDGLVLAAMNVNIWDVHDQLRALIRSRAEVDVGALTDSDTSLEALAQ
jgi:3-phenylpropionate/trans-cinnamate dioxygenase ferredoxin reductase subunit